MLRVKRFHSLRRNGFGGSGMYKTIFPTVGLMYGVNANLCQRDGNGIYKSVLKEGLRLHYDRDDEDYRCTSMIPGCRWRTCGCIPPTKRVNEKEIASI